ncbi:hypothetical protein F503_07491 [Ophiostoma piceae UAMH 11346]|uniref:Endosomal spry domain-containing protein n=1 Tax=Ophiostoma piceae (strain UAMH 11346) TaxID=1262450 RepID=S3D8F5_OPHP1|nr:hypothetical protein F503_07491 [Ophiostoma piceae UAMH 11346]
MAPTLLNHLVSKISARSAVDPTRVFDSGPLAARAMLLARDTSPATTTAIAHGSVTSADAINNKGIFALFGILGAAICIGMIWFFFWAKNGGFHFRNNDWDDYKTTVLRRRGPNGTLLSNATASTKLGGGSVYKDVDDFSNEDGRTVVTDVTGTSASSEMTGVTAGASDIMGREKRRKKREQRDRERERRREEKYNNEKSAASEKKKKEKKDKKSRSSRKVNEEGVLIDEDAEAAAEAYLRDYRHEKAARVGGINKASDSSTWDGSNPSASTAGTESTVTSELISNRERTPTSTPKKSSGGAGGIRKVYSTADRNAHREEERLRAETRRTRERSQRASHSYTAALTTTENRAERSRRDFSWKHGEDISTPLRQIEEGSSRVDDDEATSSHMPGGYAESGMEESDLGTKSYHCFIPGLSSGSPVESATEEQDIAYAEEKRKQRKERSSRRH